LSLKKYLGSYISCAKSRIFVVFAYAWPSFANLLIASNGFINIRETFLLVVSVSFAAFAIYFYNDIMDLVDDLKNKEFGNPIPASRPLGSGKVTKGLLGAFSITSAIIGVVAALMINIQVCFFQLLYLLLGIFYSTEPFRLKKRFLFKQLTIALGSITSNIVGALTGGMITTANLYLITINAFTSIGITSLNDLRDVQGDRRMAVKTFPVILGPSITIRLAIVMFTVTAASTILGYQRIGFNLASPILVSMIMLGWIYAIYPLLKNWQDPNLVNLIMFKKVLPGFVVLQIIPFIGILHL